jgi:hypothetical protein
MRFLILVLVLLWCVALLRRVFVWMLRGLKTPQQPGSGRMREGHVSRGEMQDAASARRLVRDPVCGVHVAEVLAIPLREGNGVVHFCSTACRDKYISGEKKLAANG